MIYKPRGDFVLFRLVDKGKLGSIMTPQISEQGKERVVLAIGPKVEGLLVGDRVFVIGTVGQDVVRLPSEVDVFLTREANVVLIVEEESPAKRKRGEE
mgnify:CR=1 FL=1